MTTLTAPSLEDIINKLGNSIPPLNYDSLPGIDTNFVSGEPGADLIGRQIGDAGSFTATVPQQDPDEFRREPGDPEPEPEADEPDSKTEDLWPFSRMADADQPTNRTEADNEQIPDWHTTEAGDTPPEEE